MSRVAVCMTSHNRCETTLSALRALARQSSSPPLSVVLVDAGSSDGTPEAVKGEFPDVALVQADADVFWSKGTRLAMHVALETADPCALMWLNDDTMLDPTAVARLWRALREAEQEEPGRAHVVVGSVADPYDGRTTYGGFRSRSRWRPLSLQRVAPAPQDRTPCDTFNGNVVLFSRDAVDQVGVLDATWDQGMGDVDYGFRLGRAGVGLWVAPGVVGSCRANAGPGRWRDASLPLGERWRLVTSPKGLPPGQWWELSRRWGGPLWPLVAASPYLRLLGSAAYAKVVRGRRGKP